MANTSVAELRATGLPEKARQLVFARFDFSEMTKRSLGAHWKSLDQAEQREFVDAFTQRLLVAYGKTVRATGNEKIQFGRESLGMASRRTSKPRFSAPMAIKLPSITACTMSMASGWCTML